MVHGANSRKKGEGVRDDGWIAWGKLLQLPKNKKGSSRKYVGRTKHAFDTKTKKVKKANKRNRKVRGERCKQKARGKFRVRGDHHVRQIIQARNEKGERGDSLWIVGGGGTFKKRVRQRRLKHVSPNIKIRTKGSKGKYREGGI